MKSSVAENQPSGEGVRLPGWVLWPGVVLFLAIAGIYAYSITFSGFANYDDEGFMMITIRGYLEGHPLYNEVFSAYGPAYYFYEWLVHSVAGLPLTHDITRLLCGVHWMAAAAMLAYAAYRASGAPLLGFFVFMQSMVHLMFLANEPGHPQEVVVLLLGLAALVGACASERRWTMAWLGGIGACLLFTKINVGVFYGMGLLLALVCHAPMFQSRRTWFSIALVASSAAPFLLMREHLTASWARDYSWEICAAVLAGGMVAYTYGAKQPMSLRHWYEATIGFGGFLTLLVALLLFTGSSLSAMVECLVIAPSKLAGRFCLPLHAANSIWSATGALLMAAVFAALRDRFEKRRLVIAAFKAAYGILGTYCLVSDAKGQIGYLLPWVWLVVVRVSKEQEAERSGTFFRTFLCLAAAWQGLQAYPFAGTQVTVGTFLLVLVSSLCLHDATVAVARESWWDKRLGVVVQRYSLQFKYLVFAGLLYVFAARWCIPGYAWRFHKSLTRLDLPGARRLRLPPYQVAGYRALTRYLQSSCDTFVIFPGLNSLYFWTAKPPPTYFNTAEVMLLSEWEQKQVVAALKHAKKPLIVIHETPLPFVPESEVVGKGPLSQFINEQCHVVQRAGTFQILAPNGKRGQ